jgi:putative ABC transport system permease protein
MFTAVAVATLALAIGANTAIFSIADVVLFKPLPYADADRVYVLSSLDAKTGQRLPSVPFEYLQAIDEHHSGVAGVGVRGPTTMMVHTCSDEAEWMETVAIASDYLRVLGVRPTRGRLFDADDAAQPGRLAIISYECWQRRFAGDENIVGRSIQLGDISREVIGVLPPGFMFPTTALNFLYSPTGRPEFVTVGRPIGDGASDSPPLLMRGLADEAVVRLQPGVTLPQAQAELDAIVAPLREGRTDRVVLTDPRAVLFPSGRPIMVFLVVAGGLVLLIGCANLANLLVARTRTRERELGLSAALGATRLRIIRPIIFETLIVSTAAGLFAWLTTVATFDALLRQVPPIAYGSALVQLDVRVAVFAMTLGLWSGVGFAVVPAWRAARLDVQTLIMRRRSATSRSVGAPMVAVQVGLAIVLVFGALIASRAFVTALRAPLGFSPELLVAINAQPNRLTTPDLRGFYTTAIETLARRGDVAAAGAGGSVPTDGFRGAEAVEISGNQRPVDVVYALPGYLETIGMPLLEGRRLAWEDVAGGSAAVLSESAAHALFPDGNALDAVFRTVQGRQFTVVGIVDNVLWSLSRPMPPPAYVIPPSNMSRTLTLVARMRTRGPHNLDDMRRDIGRLVPRTAVTGVWWSDSIDALTAYRNPRFQTLVLGTFAVLALGLSALGIFAVVAYAVAGRMREMGVRLAIGAPPRSLVHLMIRHIVPALLVGVAIGLVATQWLRQIAEAQLYELNARDPVTLVGSSLTVAIAALVAAYLPARRASRVDPVVVLRTE